MRTCDATQFNEIANLEAVRPRLGGEGYLNLAPILANPRNYGFQNDLGGFICVNTFGNSYEVHTIFRPERTGIEEVHNLMFRAENYMFTRTDCIELLTKVPDSNRGAARLADKFCFRDFGRQKNWQPHEGAALKRKTLEDWALQSPETYLAGKEFRGVLEAAKIAAGSTLPAHADEPEQQMTVGATMLMIRGGQARKAAGFYNYRAPLQGYAQVHLLSEAPPVLDVHDAVIGLDGAGKIEVLLCR